MRKIREVLRLTAAGRNYMEISAATGMARSSVGEYLMRARGEGVTWDAAVALTDAELDTRLFRDVGRNEPVPRPAIDFAWVHAELARPGVTLQTLWVEYREGVAGKPGPAPYGYSRFCDLYSHWRRKLGVVMRQVHRAGEKLFIDYSGKQPRIIDPVTGEVTAVELFVAVMGASNLTFAEATLSQKLPDFVASTIRAFEFLGAVPEVLVPDQLRSAVSGPDRYEPDINPTYLEMAQHYGVTVIPARPLKPRDKAKVEGGVLIAQRWILAALRNRTFFSLAELNAAIAVLLERINTRPFQKLAGCRRSAFEAIDRPAMRALPGRAYEVARWSKATVSLDYCVFYDQRVYSVPYALTGEPVEIRATTAVVEILHGGVRVASHVRSDGPRGTATIKEEHRPHAHRQHGTWSVDRVVAWAEATGPHVGAFAQAVMARRTHPETGYRTCMGTLRLADRYGRERVDAACQKALAIGSPTARTVRSILLHGLEQAPLPESPSRAAIEHEHIRGAEYFDTETSDDPGRDNSEADGHEDAGDGGDLARARLGSAVGAAIALRRPSGCSLTASGWLGGTSASGDFSRTHGCPAARASRTCEFHPMVTIRFSAR